MRIAARGAQQEAAPERAVQLLVGQIDPLACEEREHRQRVAELSGVYPREQLVDCVNRRRPSARSR
jgi:hypothetical protein